MSRTVILANGAFPRRGGRPWQLLESAARLIACDGAANTCLRRLRRLPDHIVGDLDSVKGKNDPRLRSRLVAVPDQNTNDLSKAIAFCRARGWKDLIIVGAVGKREDHALGNIFRAMEAGVEVVTDEGRFVPVVRSVRLRVERGTPISVFAVDRRTRMKSTGLEWPLDRVRFDNLYCATLNRATSATVTVTSTKPCFLFIGD